jgi:hypothetical protein
LEKYLVEIDGSLFIHGHEIGENTAILNNIVSETIQTDSIESEEIILKKPNSTTTSTITQLKTDGHFEVFMKNGDNDTSNHVFGIDKLSPTKTLIRADKAVHTSSFVYRATNHTFEGGNVAITNIGMIANLLLSDNVYISGGLVADLGATFNGNVNIGTSSNPAELNISGDILLPGNSHNIYIGGIPSNGDGGLRIHHNGTDNVFDAIGNEKTRFRTGSTGDNFDILTINNSTRNIGIGNQDPTVRLDVSGSGLFSNDLSVGGSGWFSNDLSVGGSGLFSNDLTINGNVNIGTSSDFAELNISGDILLPGNLHNIYIGGIPSNGERGLRIHHNGTDNVFDAIGNEKTRFRTGSTGDTFDILTIDNSTRNIGIGNKNPTVRLDVSGSGLFSNDLSVGGDVEIGGTITNSYFDSTYGSLRLLNGGGFDIYMGVSDPDVDTRGYRINANVSAVDYGLNFSAKTNTGNSFEDIASFYSSNNTQTIIAGRRTLSVNDLLMTGELRVNNSAYISNSATIQNGLTITKSEVFAPNNYFKSQMPSSGFYDIAFKSPFGVNPTHGPNASDSQMRIQTLNSTDISFVHIACNVNRTTTINSSSVPTDVSLLIDGGNSRFVNNVGIGKTPTTELDVDGTVTTTTLNETSDDRIKHNEQVIRNALFSISKLTPKHYFKTTGDKLYDISHNFRLNSENQPVSESGEPLIINKDYVIETGIIAQEIQTISDLKFAVRESTPLAVDYNSIHCTHIAATKELHEIVKTQQTTIEKQQEEIESLKSANTEMNSQLSNVIEELQRIKQHLGI